MSQKVITILEDDKDLREICGYTFAAEGYKVNSYATVSSFVDSQSIPDIYLLDIQLPDGNGLEVCRSLKTDPRYSAIPVIVMSAYLEGWTVPEGCGAESVVPKPFNFQKLLNRAEQLINMHRNG